MPRMRSIYAFDETDNDRPMFWDCHQDLRGWVSIGPFGRGEWEDNQGSIPDLDDAATRGCLLALVREAWDDPFLYVEADGSDDLGAWVVWSREKEYCFRGLCAGPSEREALVIALEAAP